MPLSGKDWGRASGGSSLTTRLNECPGIRLQELGQGQGLWDTVQHGFGPSDWDPVNYVEHWIESLASGFILALPCLLCEF